MQHVWHKILAHKSTTADDIMKNQYTLLCARWCVSCFMKMNNDHWKWHGASRRNGMEPSAKTKTVAKRTRRQGTKARWQKYYPRKTTLFTFDISNEKLFFIWCEDVCLLASSCILIILGHIYRIGMNTYKHRSQKPRKSANLNIKPKWCWSCRCRYRYIEYSKYMQVHLLMR